ncbi:hypothetical protein [Streptomyces sp. enrichment culture]|uniref:hypothetical protein n=1 Tax=Streptomyces sp. enrichment culture TaxID=1795815 RepID=UPI003F5474E0
MTADDNSAPPAPGSTPETPETQAPAAPAPAAPAAGDDRRHARRTGVWSSVWVMLALVVWCWFAYLMLADYGPEYGGVPGCPGPLVEPLAGEQWECRDDLRQWPALLGILALAAVTTVVAAATTVYARVLARLAGGDWTGARRGG